MHHLDVSSSWGATCTRDGPGGTLRLKPKCGSMAGSLTSEGGTTTLTLPSPRRMVGAGPFRPSIMLIDGGAFTSAAWYLGERKEDGAWIGCSVAMDRWSTVSWASPSILGPV